MSCVTRSEPPSLISPWDIACCFFASPLVPEDIQNRLLGTEMPGKRRRDDSVLADVSDKCDKKAREVFPLFAGRESIPSKTLNIPPISLLLLEERRVLRKMDLNYMLLEIRYFLDQELFKEAGYDIEAGIFFLETSFLEDILAITTAGRIYKRSTKSEQPIGIDAYEYFYINRNVLMTVEDMAVLLDRIEKDLSTGYMDLERIGMETHISTSVIIERLKGEGTTLWPPSMQERTARVYKAVLEYEEKCPEMALPTGEEIYQGWTSLGLTKLLLIIAERKCLGYSQDESYWFAAKQFKCSHMAIELLFAHLHKNQNEIIVLFSDCVEKVLGKQ